MIYGKAIQNGEPSPTTPIPIETKTKIIVKDEDGNIQEIYFGKLELKGKDYVCKGTDGKWYLYKDKE